MPKTPKGDTSKRKTKDKRPQWTLKGVDPETRTAVTKAARKARMTLAGWVDRELREAATRELKGEPKGPPPMRIEDLVKGLEKRFDDMSESLMERDDILVRVADRLDQLPETDRRSFLDRVLSIGRSQKAGTPKTV